jgi:hypothetical protein
MMQDSVEEVIQDVTNASSELPVDAAQVPGSVNRCGNNNKNKIPYFDNEVFEMRQLYLHLHQLSAQRVALYIAIAIYSLLSNQCGCGRSSASLNL